MSPDMLCELIRPAMGRADGRLGSAIEGQASENQPSILVLFLARLEFAEKTID